MLNRLHNVFSGCHSKLSRVSFPNIFILAACVWSEESDDSWAGTSSYTILWSSGCLAEVNLAAIVEFRGVYKAAERANSSFSRSLSHSVKPLENKACIMSAHFWQANYKFKKLQTASYNWSCVCIGAQRLYETPPCKPPTPVIDPSTRQP